MVINGNYGRLTYSTELAENTNQEVISCWIMKLSRYFQFKSIKIGTSLTETPKSVYILGCS